MTMRLTSAFATLQLLCSASAFSPAIVNVVQRPGQTSVASTVSTEETGTLTDATEPSEETAISKESSETNSTSPEPSKEASVRYFGPDFLDEAKLYADSTFPIKPDDLILRAKEVLAADCAIGQKDDGKCLAEDFSFQAQVIGPIGKEEYLGALESFNLEECFDTKANFFGFNVDPMQTNRVWFMNRVEAKHVGTFMGAEPTGKEIVYPPQSFHLDFNEQGKVTEIGFYTIDRYQGNTGGLGGAFGFMYGVGKPLPIPECQPYKRSKRFRLLVAIGELGKRFKKNKETSGKKN